MGDSRRGPLLTTIAILFAILALTDLLKPLKLEGPTTGLVFFGIRQSGIANLILGPLMGLILLFYAAGIWRLRRYAMALGWLYAAYVIVNLVLYTRLNPPAKNSGELVFGIVYMVLAIVITVGTAITLTRRRTELA
jgi:tryptophan-rich sensory protein